MSWKLEVVAMLVCLDTNFLLHFEWMDPGEIADAVGVPVDQIQIAVCHQLLSELDKKKNEGGALAHRARERIKRLADLVENDDRYTFVDAAPKAIWDNSEFLLHHAPDDQFFASLMATGNPATSILFFSDDTGARLRASRTFGFRVHAPSGRRLAHPSPEAKQLKIVQAKLAKLESRQANVAISGSLYPFREPDVATLARKFAARCEAGGIPIPDWPKSSPGTRYRARDVERFNREREQFANALSEYPRKFAEWEAQFSRAVVLLLKIENSGTRDANDIEAHITLESGMWLQPPIQPPSLPPEPRPPKPMRDTLSSLLPLGDDDAWHSPASIPLIRSEEFIDENTYWWSKNRLRPKRSQSIGPLLLQAPLGSAGIKVGVVIEEISQPSPKTIDLNLPLPKTKKGVGQP